jgi:hypothetical protein
MQGLFRPSTDIKNLQTWYRSIERAMGWRNRRLQNGWAELRTRAFSFARVRLGDMSREVPRALKSQDVPLRTYASYTKHSTCQRSCRIYHKNCDNGNITWIQPRTNAVDYLGHPSDLEAMIGLEAVRRRSFDSWFSGIRDNPFGYWKPLY